MGRPDIIAIANQWIQAFNEHNIEALLGLYHNQARHYSPRIAGGWIAGKEQLRKWWQSSFDTLPGLGYKLRDLTIGQERGGYAKMFMEYIRRVPGEADSQVMEYFCIKDNLIVESRVLGSWPVGNYL